VEYFRQVLHKLNYLLQSCLSTTTGIPLCTAKYLSLVPFEADLTMNRNAYGRHGRARSEKVLRGVQKQPIPIEENLSQDNVCLADKGTATSKQCQDSSSSEVWILVLVIVGDPMSIPQAIFYSIDLSMKCDVCRVKGEVNLVCQCQLLVIISIFCPTRLSLVRV
jgi:hypothetical protein